MGSEGGKKGLMDVFFKRCVEELSKENRFALPAAGQVKSTGWRSAGFLNYLCCCYAHTSAVSRVFLPRATSNRASL